MSTTLDLFWHLSSANKKERLDASAKLVSALQHFQASFVPQESSDTSEDEHEEGTKKTDGLDVMNAQDVSYTLRRLIRGLASPRESSRLGFAVALTELLSRIDTVTCSQIFQLILDSSKTQGSMTGQEERDVLFARLFGLTSIIQSGLLLRETTLPSSSTLASDLSSFKEVLAELMALGEKKSWLRESAWWSMGLAVDALIASRVSWKDDALDALVAATHSESRQWTPDKVALTLKLQAAYPSRDWNKALSPTFKHADLLSTENLTTLARVLKEADVDEDEGADLPKSGAWKPRVHFVWDVLLDHVLPISTTAHTGKAPRAATSFPDFFRIVVDESLFASTSSPERKYWGFQIFQKALPRVSSDDMPMLFTKNFMRSWINHLSNSDRYLHKAARQVASSIQTVVENSPTIGFSLILQLTGVNGSRQFDRLTKTKTVESILTSMDQEGIESYIDYLLKQVDEESFASAHTASDVQALNTRRAWIIDQLSALVRNGAVPRSDAWIQTILDWLTVHGLFIIAKKSDKASISALRSVPSPVFSEELRKNCRERLLACLAELTVQTTLVTEDGKTSKPAGVASDGQFWVSRVLSTIEALEKDTKHVRPLSDPDEEDGRQQLRQKARELVSRLKAVSGDRREAARGVELLLSTVLMHGYCAEDDDADLEPLENALDGASRMFPPPEPKDGKKKKKGSKKGRKSIGDDGDDDDGADTNTNTNANDGKDQASSEPVDVLVDVVVGFLEQGTAYMRAAANQVFALLSGSVKETTIDLVVAQLERRDPGELAADEDVEMDGEDGTDDNPDSASDNAGEDEEEDGAEGDDDDEEEDDDDDVDEEADLELRQKIEEALRVNGIAAATGDDESEDEEDLMDDDQMLAIDDQLAAAFKSRVAEKRRGKDVDAQREATYFKNRVLDLVDVFVRKQPTSPLVIRLVFPLVQLIAGASSDEKQLADKATGILRTRIGKSRELPASVSHADATKALQELHHLARKASTPDVLATSTQCSLYLSKVLVHAGAPEPVLDAYRASLHDFVSRKNSRLAPAFFEDLIKRQPQGAWGLRDDLIEASRTALNAYRQGQTIHFLQMLVNQIPALSEKGDRKAEVLAFMPKLRQAIFETVTEGCTSSSALQPQSVKELLKLALVAVRQTKRVSPEDLPSTWQPTKWSDLSSKLASHDRFKASVSLQDTCKQIVQIIQDSTGSKSKTPGKDKKAVAKRKAEDMDATHDKGTKKTENKKARKAKSG